VRRAWLPLALLLAVPAPAAAAAPEPLWSVRAVAFGSYTLDYGDDGDPIDGQGTGNWRWELKALADGFNVDTGTTIFRMTVAEASDIVLAGRAPSCRPPAGTTIDWVREPRAGLFLSSSRGFQVNHPFFDLLDGCHVGAHGMGLYDGATPAETRVPRGAFRPRRDSTFKRTWTQVIALDRTHESGTPHSFRADGTITIRLKRLTKRAARAFKLRLRSVPPAPSG
jgi:hypothetical protein